MFLSRPDHGVASAFIACAVEVLAVASEESITLMANEVPLRKCNEFC